MLAATVNLQLSVGFVTVIGCFSVLAWADGVSGIVSGSYNCPSGCRCTMPRRQQQPQLDGLKLGRKVVCQSGTPINRVTTSFVETLPKDTIHLDLSGNAIEELQRGTFQSLPGLQRLNLSANPITSIEQETFSGLSNLERLDLSATRLTALNSSMLEGIPNLQRLILQNSSIRTLQSGVFDVLPTATRIDLQTSSLVCDCHLEWIVDWLRNRSTSVRIDDLAVCNLPTALRGKSMKMLRKSDLHCEYPLELPVFELSPSTSQVAFEGDKLPLECRVTEPLAGTTMNVTWIRESTSDEIQTDQSRGLFVDARSLPERIRLTTLIVEHLDAKRDTGNWTCRVTTSQNGFVEQSVYVLVLSANSANKSQYCPLSLTDSNRGRYIWPRTLNGVEQDLACVSTLAAVDVKPEVRFFSPRARRRCSRYGQWMEPDLSECRFTSETTRTLEEYSHVVAGNQTDQLNNLAENLKRLIGGGHAINDKDDLIFLSRVVEGLSRSVGSNNKLAEVIVDLVSLVMNVSPSLLLKAHQEDRVCTRLVKSIEEVAEQLLNSRDTVSLETSNIMIRAHKVEPRGFLGIRCTALAESSPNSDLNAAASSGSQKSHRFACTDMKPENEETNGRYSLQSKVSSNQQIGASVSILANYIHGARCNYPECSHMESYRMTFVVYQNASPLFPLLMNDSTSSVNSISSTVLTAKIAGLSSEGVSNFTGHVTVSIAVPAEQGNTVWTPVSWNSTANGGLGAWLSESCFPVGNVLQPSVVTFRCTHLSSFALLRENAESTAVEALLSSWEQTGIIVYVGSAILIMCLVIVIMVYIIHRRSISMSRKLRHSVVNMCFALLLLCVVYTLGIRVGRQRFACRLIGIILHYLSLCVPLWITVIAYKLYNKLFKLNGPRNVISDEAIGDERHKSKPVVTSYLLGWGVAVIVCGISGAINWINYATEQFCFLALEAAFLTLFVPAGVILLINFLLFLRICCMIRTSSLSSWPNSRNTCDDPDTDETHVPNEIEVLAPRTEFSSLNNHHNRHRRRHSTKGLKSNRSNSVSSCDSSADVLDPAYRTSQQLCAIVAIFALFSMVWASAAFVITMPFDFEHSDLVYQCLYAAAATGFGIFLVVYYCVGRNELHGALCRCCSNRKQRMQSKISDVQSCHKPSSIANGHAVSTASDRCSDRVVTLGSRLGVESSAASVAERASLASKSIGSDLERSVVKIPPCGVVSSSSVSATVPPSAEVVTTTSVPDYAMFYNPRQNGVAKKYWERARKRRAAADLRHKPPSDLDTESIGRGRNVLQQQQHNGTLSRRPLLDGGVTSADSRVSTLTPTEQQPLLPILNPLTLEPGKELNSGTGAADIPSAPVGFSQQQPQSIDGIKKPDHRRFDGDGRLVAVPRAVHATDNGMQQTLTCNGERRKVNRDEKRTTSFIEQLQQRIPLPPTAAAAAASATGGCRMAEIDSSVMSSGCEMSKSNDVSQPDLLDVQVAQSTDKEDSREQVVSPNLTAYTFMNKNYGATSPRCGFSTVARSSVNGVDETTTTTKEQWATCRPVDHSQTRRSSLSDLSASDIWVMQTASCSSKTETSV